MMKMKWQHGVMVSLFIGGLLVGSGGVVGLADETDVHAPYDLRIDYYIKAIDEGQPEQRKLYKSASVRVTPGEVMSGSAELNAFLHSDRVMLKAPVKSEYIMWTYSGQQTMATVNLNYVNEQNGKVITSRKGIQSVSIGGKVNIAAPTGYKLTDASVVNRMVKTIHEDWNIAVKSVSSQTGTTPAPQPTLPGKPQPKPLPGATTQTKPGIPGTSTSPEKPSIGTKPVPSETGKPLLPIRPSIPNKPNFSGKPVDPTPFVPVTHPELVVPVDEYPATTVPKPNVIYTPEGPVNATELNHTSELNEHPVTAVDGSAAVTGAPAESKPSKRPQAPSQAKPHRTASPLQHISTSGRRLPQTDEQTSKGSLLGMVALAGLGVIRFRRFLH